MIDEILLWFQNITLTLGDAWTWLTTPFPLHVDLEGEFWIWLNGLLANLPQLTPLALFGITGFTAVLILHIAHLINVVAG